MNAPNTFRSVFTIREKEIDESLLKLVIKSTDSARNKLNKEGINCVVNGKSIHIDVDIKEYNEGSQIQENCEWIKRS